MKTPQIDISSFFGIILKYDSITVLGLLCCFSFHLSFAQTIISGKIVDENNEPIPFVHLHIENTTLGTVSNENGQFRLVCDNGIEKKPVIISALGYRTKKIFLKEGIHTLSLAPEITQLKGVTLVPMDYGRELINKAIKAIPNNYPKVEERHTGFIRETTGWKNNKIPIYIAEAVLESIKKPYSKKHLSGNVKLDEFRKYVSGQLDSLITRIHAGTHHIHRFDIVARREAFLGNPNSFEYKIKDTLRQRNENIYKIHFQNKNGLSGHVYILDSSFAIVKAEVKDLSFTSWLNMNGRQYLNYTVTYEQGEDNIWRFKHSHYETAFNEKGKVLELRSDYVTTKIEPNSLDIPYAERFQFADILLDKPKQYSPDFWSNYNIILSDEKVERMFQSTDTIKNKKNGNRPNKLIQILHRFKSQMTLNWEPINITPFSVSYENTAMEIQESGTFVRRNTWGISTSLLYEIRPDLFMGYVFKSNLSKTGITSHDLVVSKSMNLNPNGRPILISPNVELGYQELYSPIGTYQNTGDFSVNGKTFDNNRIEVFLSQRNFHVQPNITLEVEKNRRINFVMSFGYNFQFNETAGLLFHEKDGFFLFRKKAFLKNGEDELFIESENKNLLENKVDIRIGVAYRF